MYQASDPLHPQHPGFDKLKFVLTFNRDMMFWFGGLVGALMLYLALHYNLWPISVVFLSCFGGAGADMVLALYRYWRSMRGETKYL